MKVFVTGASGFVGQSVVRELLSNGHKVLGLARNDKNAAALTALGVEVHRGSLEDLESLAKGAAACDGVAHLAFMTERMDDYQATCAADRAAITAMGEALVGTNRPLVLTSGTLLLPRDKLANEDEGIDANNPIAATRGQSETVTLEFTEKGVRSSVIRLPPTVHGEGDHGLIPMMIMKAQQSKIAAYTGDGENRWPAVHVKDAARLYRLALEKGTAGSVYHAIAEEAVRMKEITEVIGKKTGFPIVSKTMEEAQEHFGFLSFAYSADSPASSEKTREQLGWKPENLTLLADLESAAYKMG